MKFNSLLYYDILRALFNMSLCLIDCHIIFLTRTLQLTFRVYYFNFTFLLIETLICFPLLACLTNDQYMIHMSCHEVAETNVYFYASSESVIDIFFVHHLLELQRPKPVLCTGVKNASSIAHCISFTYENEKKIHNTFFSLH